MAPLSLIVNGRTDERTPFHQCQQVIFAKSKDDLKRDPLELSSEAIAKSSKN